MAKKKNKVSSLSTFAVLVAVIFGLASSAMIFLTAFNGVMAIDVTIVQASKTVSFTGVQVSFGHSIVRQAWGSTITTEVLSTNLFSLIGYSLPLVCVVILILFKNDKFFNRICAGGFIASAIFALLSVTTFNNAIISEIYTAYDYTLGIGSILCAVFTFIAGIVTLYKTIVIDK